MKSTLPTKQYTFSGGKVDEEWQRLDTQYDGITGYLGDRLTLAPLESPTRILELGAGSGRWAASAAEEFPEAEVLAVDMTELPPREFPPNVCFQQLDVLKDFPWKDPFDVIHMRLLLFHLPHPAELIKRLIPLIKPGGWLLIEDCCLMRFKGEIGSACKKRNDIMRSYMASKDRDPEIGAHLEEILQSIGGFDIVKTHKVSLPLNPLPEDSSTRLFAETMRNSIMRASRSLCDELVQAGITHELQSAWEEEMSDSRYEPIHDFFFVWAQKS